MDSTKVDSSSIGARCAYCRTPWTQDDAVQCPECDTVSHRECWLENGGCPILSCAAAPRDEVTAANSAGPWGSPSATGTSQAWTAAAARASTPAARLPALDTSAMAQSPIGTSPADESTHRRAVGATSTPAAAAGPDTVDTGTGDEPWWNTVGSTADNSPENASWGTSTQAASQQPVPQHAIQPPPSAHAATEPAAGLPAAGWYPDPYSDRYLRWWDGRTWSDSTHPR